MFQANKIFRRSTSTPLAQGETTKARRRILIVLSPRILVEKLDSDTLDFIKQAFIKYLYVPEIM